MKIAFLFPGQGSQMVGMGKDLAAAHPAVAALYEKANQVLGRDLRSTIFEGPEDVLKDTSNTQPALYVTNLAALQLAKAWGLQPQFYAGHSLGEYCALQAAGVFSFEDGLTLVQARATAMRDVGAAGAGAMAAILGLEDDKVTLACQQASQGGSLVQCANYNSPGQVVISGHRAAVEKAVEACKAAGALKCVMLPVSGAFHSELMRPAGTSLRAAFGRAAWNAPATSVVSNVDAKVHASIDDIQQSLVDQVSGSVLWTQSVRAMIQMGATHFVELGPGKVLQGLLKKIDRSVPCFSAGDLETLTKGPQWQTS
jgi:[acyl-carrier-protein] S-malonyltransferase